MAERKFETLSNGDKRLIKDYANLILALGRNTRFKNDTLKDVLTIACGTASKNTLLGSINYLESKKAFIRHKTFNSKILELKERITQSNLKDLTIYKVKHPSHTTEVQSDFTDYLTICLMQG